jgi:ribosomal protein S18 acetylase RimI-like enzyme
MHVERTRDKARIRAALRLDPALHVYELGDLDDFFFAQTTWYVDDDAVALLYTAPQAPVLAAFARPDGHAKLAALLARIAGELPHGLYAHLTPGLASALGSHHTLRASVAHLKMALTDPARVPETTGVEQLSPAHAGELAAFYARCYPDNYFDPRMLETGQFFAIRDGGAIVAAAGVHVYSATERVAALGSIAADPEQRRRGLGTRVTAALCASLRRSVDVIGLNVKADNAAAIACYEQLGFTPVAPFDDCRFDRL